METEYNKAILERLKSLPKFYLGEEVFTPDGSGIIVELSMEWNGLYVSEERSKAVVWYSTDEAQNGWVSNAYSLKILDECNNLQLHSK